MAWLSALLKSLPFANGAMLLWGLAAALPIIIHLWNKRKYKEMQWAAMEYLLAAIRKNSRRIRIEQLILLLIRVAILLLLALALADPIWSLFPSLGASLGAGGHTHFVLVVDGSYSMDYRPDGKSRFELARDLASQVIDDSRQGDGFTLILMSDPPEVVIGEPAFAPKDVQEEMDNLRLRHAGASLEMTLAEIDNMIGKARKQHPRLTDTKICFFSDLCENTWSEVSSEDARRRIGQLAENATMIVMDVGQGEAQNIGVTRLNVKESLLTAGRPITVETEIQNLGSSSDRRVRVELLIDGQSTAEKQVDVAAGSPSTAAFNVRLESPGEHYLEARIDDPNLLVDNFRWISVPVRESIRVLCIEGRQGAARHVALAIAPDTSGQPRIDADVRSESALLEADLNEFDCVVLCNIGRFSRDEAGVLHDYLANGGGLIFTLGDQVQADSYNEEVGGELSDKRSLPARLDAAVVNAQYFFDPLEYRHPIVEPFRGYEQSGLLTTPVWKYFRLEPFDSSAARVALAFESGDPAIIEERILRGRSIMLATAASPESLDRSVNPPTPWTALSTWPSFPPLVQEMLAVAVTGRRDDLNLLVGDPLEGSVQSTAANLPLSVILPGGQSERVRMKIDGANSRWTFGNTNWSGMYKANYGPPLDRSQWFAVNVDSRESDLTRFDADLLPSQFRRDFAADEAAPSLPSTRPVQYFRYLLGMVLILLIVETFLAYRFGTAA